MTTPPKPPPMKPKGTPPAPVTGRIPKPPGAPAAATRQPKTFKVEAWSGSNEGEKVILYGGSGIGKTSLLATKQGVVFVGLDDGARKIGNPLTGEPVMAIQGVMDFADLRDVLHSPNLLDNYTTLGIDTGTVAEQMAERYVIQNVKTDKGASVKSIEGFGWGKGYKHVQDHMRLLQQDMDALIRRGKNVVILAQESEVVIANAEGVDYLQSGPKFLHNKQLSVRQDYCEWADHVLRVGFLDTTVAAGDGDRRGKIVATADSLTRAIFTTGARHFFAKSRTLRDPVIQFTSNQDDTLWRILFPQEYQ